MSAVASLDDCAREAIHIPGAIQPHGVLLVLDESDLVCLQASVNAAEFFGANLADLVGASLHGFAPEVGGVLTAVVTTGDPEGFSPLAIHWQGARYDASLRRTAGGLIVEIEPAGPRDAPRFQQKLLTALGMLRSAPTLAAQHGHTVRFIAELSGFERVMLYQFDEEWHGKVVAEHLNAGVDSYLGLSFPASDIPEQARELYLRNWLRIIPDSSYEPVPLHPALNPRTGRPLDMSFVTLRSVSPVHAEYLRNMDVGASMSISLIVDGKLWGLIACHHRARRVLTHGIRAICEIFGQVASLEIATRQEGALFAQYHQATAIQSEFFDVLAGEQNVADALVKFTPQLLAFMGAGGAAIHINGRTTLVGVTPELEEVAALIEWLGGRELSPMMATDRLSRLNPAAQAYQTEGSGLLAVKLSRVASHYILWFRPDQVTSVTWAGRPEKVVDEAGRISPRKSFAAWQETLTGQSLPWGKAERKGAGELVLAINALVLRRTETLLGLNAELEKTNTDLNSFAHIASHDLKEPLRGVQNYLRFMKLDHGSELSTEALRKIDTMASLITQSKELVDALSHFAKVGRMEITRRATNIDTLLDQVLVGLESSIAERGFAIRRHGKFPTVSCDLVLMREVFSNLLSNALKYNDKAERWVEIGTAGAPGETPKFFVRDNGIGIRAQYYEDIFKMFRRLHPPAVFGGGTGAGLAIVKSIVERHGGRVWVESDFGEETTFWFQLE